MAYSAAAEQRRRCAATRRDGEPCKGWSAWGDPLQRCGGHGGRRPPGMRKPVCRCIAYNWPHRPGGGLCRWPEEPYYRSTTPAGTHGEDRNRRRRVPWAYRLRTRDR